jgi:hypothetical protein
MGNIQQESTYNGIPFNPNAKNTNSGAYGIGQWLGGRKNNLVKYANDNHLSVASLSTQLQFMWTEVTGGEATFKSIINSNGGLNALKNMNVKDACDLWEKAFERAGAGANMSKRYQYANDIYAKFGNGTGNVSSSGGVATVPTNKYLGTPYASTGGYTFTTKVVGSADASQADNYANTSLGTGKNGLPVVNEAAPKAVDYTARANQLLKYPIPYAAKSYSSTLLLCRMM